MSRRSTDAIASPAVAASEPGAACGDEYTARWPGGPPLGVLHVCDKPTGHPDGGYFVHGADVDAGLADWAGDDPERLEWTGDGGDCRTMP